MIYTQYYNICSQISEEAMSSHALLHIWHKLFLFLKSQVFLCPLILLWIGHCFLFCSQAYNHTSHCIAQNLWSLSWHLSFIYIPQWSFTNPVGSMFKMGTKYSTFHDLHCYPSWIISIAYLVSLHLCPQQPICHITTSFYLLILSRIMSFLCSKSSKVSFHSE